MNVSIISSLWAGILLGVSFIATPAKFLAPSLSMPEALEVGQATFGVLTWVELSAVLLTTIALRTRPLIAPLTGLFGLVLIILLLQYVVMLPILDERAQRIIEGAKLGASQLHWVYILMEFVKIAALLAMSVVAYRDPI